MGKSPFLDILLPSLCLGCKTEACLPARQGFFICGACREKMDIYRYFVCPMCKIRSIDGRLGKNCRKMCGLTRFLGAPLPYSNEIVKKIIYAFKYQRAREVARPLSQILIEFLDKNNFEEVSARYRSRLIIAPVPLYDFRERERGFNQATEICKIISAYYKIPLYEGALIRTKNTEPQADIKNKEDRAKNIAGAFSINKRGLAPRIGSDPDSFMQNKIVILIDDVYTSGATMRECALVLRESGAAEVWGVTVARG